MSSKKAEISAELTKLEFNGILDWIIKIESPLDVLQHHKSLAITQLSFLVGTVIICIHGKITLI